MFAAIGAAIAVGLIRRMPRTWWIPGSVAVVAFGAITTYAGPIVLDPIFNRFTPLPAGQTRSDVLDLAQKAGVDVGQVYVMDASRRTTAANAYVNGLGHTKRVVLYDNLLDDFSRDETRLVVAHELGHVRYDDVPRGLIWLAIVTPFGLFAASRMTLRLAPQEERPGPAVLPALALSVAVIVFLITIGVQPALQARRGARRLLLAAAHRRAGRVHLLPAADRAEERQRPRPVGLDVVPVRHPPDDGRPHRHGRRGAGGAIDR